MFKDNIALLRPRHWIKNVIIFFPLIFGKKIYDFQLDLRLTLVFLCFCGISSSIYILNDLFDMKEDKLHPLKCLRPLASGRVSLRMGKILAISLLSFLLPAAFYLNISFFQLSLIYVIVNLIYTLFLKEIVIIDVFCLAMFFLIRLAIGSLVTNIALSHWIILVTALLALFLGFNKRRQELGCLSATASTHRKVLRDYNQQFIDQLISIISAALLVAYTLYTVDRRTVTEMGSLRMMYTVPFVYYGVFRYLYLLQIKYKDGDPTRVFFTDTPTRINVFLWILTCVLIVYGGSR